MTIPDYKLHYKLYYRAIVINLHGIDTDTDILINGIEAQTQK